MDISGDCPPPVTEGSEELANNQQNCPTDEVGGGISAEKKHKLGSFLQSHSIKLEDGCSHAALDYVEQDGKSAYLCFPCAATCYTESTLQDHLQGKVHANRLSSTTVFPSSILTNHPFFKINKPDTSDPAGGGASTENILLPVVASEHDHDLDLKQKKAASKLWHFFESYTQSPIVGLEYVLEIRSDYDDFISFYCTLCQKKGDQICFILSHLVSNKHKRKYLRNHYWTAYNALERYDKNVYYKSLGQVTDNICKGIEQAFGRLPPTIVINRNFLLKKFYMSIPNIEFLSNQTKALSSTHHFSEKDGGTFEELVDCEYIMLLHKSELVVDSDGQSADNDGRCDLEQVVADVKGHKTRHPPEPYHVRVRNYVEKSSERRLRNRLERSPSREKRRGRGRSRSPMRRFPQRNKSPHHHQKPRDAPQNDSPHRPPVKEPLASRNEKAQFRMLRRRLDDLMKLSRKTLEYHEKHPEKHPLYQEEWKKYWNKRYKELKAGMPGFMG